MIERLVHPGPAPARRWAVAPCRAEPVDLVLPVADRLADSVALALADFDGGWLEIEEATLGTLDFVIPGEDPTGAHAAWYAGPYRMGAGRIVHLGLHAGRKEGGPWLHGHGAFAAPGWEGPDFGHILPFESRLAQPIRARGWGLKGARLEVSADTETHFPLFQPVALGAGGNAALVTLRPNQDITLALEAAVAEAGIRDGRVYGLGSVVRPKLEGQPRIDSFATELLLTEAEVRGGRARLGIEVVTLQGARHRGVLERGENGVCITAEVLVVADRGMVG
ncbi:hypothetical protein [Pararhodobacter aggregans]|uniref:DUF296 domain-containing protein n=1 Tax=Pararhodobacter aggregans TaxID=404875 RepID=A0A2T7ULD7_9RHOB|nr:hypothetical protein [Pararhodobacter aggregans]PTW99781.1 hypothetical protein C8N33_11333 [Pararhodobacter aggregans]PVE45487.1 hypothetical protein DDE23_20915 [Pararhodobacter aggregans]